MKKKKLEQIVLGECLGLFHSSKRTICDPDNDPPTLHKRRFPSVNEYVRKWNPYIGAIRPFRVPWFVPQLAGKRQAAGHIKASEEGSNLRLIDLCITQL